MATPNELPTAVHKLDSLMVYLVGMILVRMGKKKMRRENMRENGWEEGREKSGGAQRFSLQPTKTQSTNISEPSASDICQSSGRSSLNLCIFKWSWSSYVQPWKLKLSLRNIDAL